MEHEDEFELLSERFRRNLLAGGERDLELSEDDDEEEEDEEAELESDLCDLPLYSLFPLLPRSDTLWGGSVGLHG